MSNVSRSSIDLGVKRTSSSSVIESPPKENPRVLHPTRLQHSPSLPNIWFPPHSGPIPREMSNAEKEPTHRPSAPPSPNSKPPVVLVDNEPQIRHVKYASIDPTYHKPSVPKTHARRRTERDQPHSLLTPPLTPSSSIRTNASTDYAGSATTQTSHDINENIAEDILDTDTESTRILLLENVSREVDISFLEAAILDALACTQSEKKKNLNVDASPNSSAAYPRDSVKGMNSRKHKDEGKVFMVFFDVRIAKATRDMVIDRDTAGGRLRDCVDKLIGEDGHPSWLSGRLITLEELFNILGHASFLDGIDSSFSLTVTRINYKEDAENSVHVRDDDAGGHDESKEPRDKSTTEDAHSAESGINVAFLQNILKSFGSIRFFRLTRQEADQQGSATVVYHVEYHDLRDAETAYEDLNNKTMFGMSIKVFRKKLNPEPTSEHALPSADMEPFPNVATAGESFSGLRIGPAGFQSQIRQRFIPGHENPHGAQTNYEVTTQTQIQPTAGGGTSSPPVFYVSPFVDIMNQHAQTAYREQDPNHAMRFPGPSDTGPSQIMPLMRRPAPAPEPAWDHDTIYRSGAISPCYNHDGICSYCPSRGAMHGVAYNVGMGFGHYGLSPSPTPSLYYPPQIATPQMVPSMMNSAQQQTPPPAILGYEYVDPQSLQSVPPAWYDPAIQAVGPGPAAAAHIGRTGAPYARYLNPSRPPMFHSLHSADNGDQAAIVSQTITTFSQLSLSSASSPSSHHSATLGAGDAPTAVNSHPGTGGGGRGDNNQLDLAKIMGGGDTRTTVMIKNIPNKMSDGDLMSYIAKVCPRRIDFLYLRMDFKNGCNVGYAFVNFIKVEDLIHFAKERLGAKWNMFSSEKVLQMSYANYQGKEALVEKFKNSAIMDERESWRPRIFYSFGPQQGLPEPFPAPTHIRRKERSSYNRGTLFPPGMNSHNSGMSRKSDEGNGARRGDKLLLSRNFHSSRV